MYTRNISLFLKGTFSFILSLIFSSSFAQELALDGWNMHLPYQSCHYVTGSDNYVWCATDYGLFRLNKADYSLDRITKIEGLSDLNIGAIKYNAANDLLFVGYQNGNIDLIKGNAIINLPDIKNAQIIGDKTIHNIYFIGDLAYLSVGFGIVVIDTDRNEVKDTYMIGNNGTNLEVYDIVSDGITLYVGTANGIYFAPVNNQYLSNFATWNRFPIGGRPFGIPNGDYNALIIHNNQLVACWAAQFPNRAWQSDSVFYCNLSSSVWDTLPRFQAKENPMDLFEQNGTLYLSDVFKISVWPGPLNVPASNSFYSLDGSSFLRPDQVFVDITNTVWESDVRFGLVKMIDASHGASYYPNGPLSTNSYWMCAQDQSLLVVPGGHDDAWNNVFNIDGPGFYDQHVWTDYSPQNVSGLDTLYDFITCAIDPQNKQHQYLGSWGEGLVEMTNGVVTNVYDDNNSILQSNIVYHWIGVGGMQYDTSNNLWMTNSHVLKCLVVKKADGTWKSFDFTGLIPVGETVSELMITSTGQKWMILPRGQGILVFDDNGTIDNINDDKKNRLGFNTGNGKIPGTEVYCMAEDDDGEVWIGTDKGIGVFYCAQDATTAGGCDAQQILIEQDGYIQILMETQTVTAILVDGANRKWIGTESGGLFLMSADGTKELAHFIAANSPLLSDEITSLAMNKTTGELFIGTSKGIVSYRGEATEGTETMGDVYAFPNPVHHEYTGPIAITGLVKDANVKITDVRGQLVYETTALGGQAIWPGTNFKGERAATGVYVVFISNDDGTQTKVTKILLVN